MEVKHIHWVAAFLDGEGYFTWNQTPQIQVSQSDLDIVQKYKNYTGATTPIGFNERSKKNPNHSDQYILTISGMLAIQWMMTIYSLMSIRRKARIREVIQKWKEAPNRQKGADYCVNGHPLLIEGEQFYIQANGAKVCNICRRDYAGKRWQENREENNKKQREYYNKNREENAKNQKVKKYKRKEDVIIQAIAKAQNISIDDARKVWNDMMGVH